MWWNLIYLPRMKKRYPVHIALNGSKLRKQKFRVYTNLKELPSGHKAIKWAYKLKRNKEATVELYKARLVAKGCSQRYGIDYNETFSPVVRYVKIRLLLALHTGYIRHSGMKWRRHITVELT